MKAVHFCPGSVQGQALLLKISLRLQVKDSVYLEISAGQKGDDRTCWY
jgi:hypothetical protein